jgi:hypothetical protein
LFRIQKQKARNFLFSSTTARIESKYHSSLFFSVNKQDLNMILINDDNNLKVFDEARERRDCIFSAARRGADDAERASER